MSGDVKKITISNCIFDGTERGIRIKTARGRGGVVEDIRVDNIIMKNITGQAIVLDMEYAKIKTEPVSERTPRFRNIRFSNITAYTKEAMYINGLEEMPVQEISLHDVVFEAVTGMVIRNAVDIELQNVRVNTTTGASLQAENVERLLVNGFSNAKPQAEIPLMKMLNVQEVLVTTCWAFAGTKIFAAVNGSETRNVKFMHNELSGASITVGEEVKKEEIVR